MTNVQNRLRDEAPQMETTEMTWLDHVNNAIDVADKNFPFAEGIHATPSYMVTETCDPDDVIIDTYDPDECWIEDLDEPGVFYWNDQDEEN